MSQQYKVLVVDDDLKLRSLLERYLTEQGFVVRGVANGEQADRLLTRENFSLMVLDLMLPGEDGLSICRRLREAGNQIPVLMLTAKGDEVDRIVGLEMGADDYLPKPFNPRELLARIHVPPHRRHRRIKAQIFKFFHHLAHVAAATVLHRQPLRPVEYLQQAVVAAKAYEGGERVIEHGLRRAGPDRGGHRQ